jgi:hypothetical protein
LRQRRLSRGIWRKDAYGSSWRRDVRLLHQATQIECKVRVSASVAAPAHVGLPQSIEAKAVAKRRHMVPGPSVGACVSGSSLVLLTCAVPCFWLPAASARGESASATHPFPSEYLWAVSQAHNADMWFAYRVFRCLLQTHELSAELS